MTTRLNANQQIKMSQKICSEVMAQVLERRGEKRRRREKRRLQEAAVKGRKKQREMKMAFLARTNFLARTAITIETMMRKAIAILEMVLLLRMLKTKTRMLRNYWVQEKFLRSVSTYLSNLSGNLTLIVNRARTVIKSTAYLTSSARLHTVCLKKSERR